MLVVLGLWMKHGPISDAVRGWIVKRAHVLALLASCVAAAAAFELRALGERLDDTDEIACDTLEASEPAAAALHDDRVEVPLAGLPHKGAPVEKAAVSMVECSDYQCRFCSRARITVELLLERNEDLAFHYAQSPLRLRGANELGARAAVAAHRQRGFWALHAALFDTPLDSEEDAIALASRLQLDTDQFARDLRDPAVAAEVRRQRTLCTDAGVRAVPTFFINGKRVVGSLPIDQLQAVIDAERR